MWIAVGSFLRPHYFVFSPSAPREAAQCFTCPWLMSGVKEPCLDLSNTWSGEEPLQQLDLSITSSLMENKNVISTVVMLRFLYFSGLLHAVFPSTLLVSCKDARASGSAALNLQDFKDQDATWHEFTKNVHDLGQTKKKLLHIAAVLWWKLSQIGTWCWTRTVWNVYIFMTEERRTKRRKSIFKLELNNCNAHLEPFCVPKRSQRSPALLPVQGTVLLLLLLFLSLLPVVLVTLL